MSKPKILVITSTVRDGRVGRKIAEWFINEAKAATDEVEFELFDIKDLNLPLFNSGGSPMMGIYDDIQKNLAGHIGSADGFVVVTGEYNYSPPGSLKNFLDYLFQEWNRKPVAFVGYGGSGGKRSIAHLVDIFSALDAMPISASGRTVHFNPFADFNESGELIAENVEGNLDGLLDELLWWTKALKEARNK